MARKKTTEPEERKTYHHGNLREVLLTDALEMIRESGVEQISLRRLAKRAGVSHNAPYMHFQNRDALLAAIAQLGFQKLTQKTKTASTELANLPWRERFRRGCALYVEFSVENPELFRVMFMGHNIEQFPDYVTDSMTALKTLESLIRDGQAAGELKPGPADVYTNYVFSLLHGLAALHFDRQVVRVPFGESSISDITAQFADLTLGGLGVANE